MDITLAAVEGMVRVVSHRHKGTGWRDSGFPWKAAKTSWPHGSCYNPFRRSRRGPHPAVQVTLWGCENQQTSWPCCKGWACHNKSESVPLQFRVHPKWLLMGLMLPEGVIRRMANAHRFPKLDPPCRSQRQWIIPTSVSLLHDQPARRARCLCLIASTCYQHAPFHNWDHEGSPELVLSWGTICVTNQVHCNRTPSSWPGITKSSPFISCVVLGVTPKARRPVLPPITASL